MKRLVIAVDCDDVLVLSTEHIVTRYNALYGTNVQLAEAHTSNNPGWRASREEIAQRIYDIQLDDSYGEATPLAAAIEVCARLSRRHHLHLVTARPGRVIPVTIAMIEAYFPGVFREIEHVGLDGNKGDVCRRLQADVLIDDNYKHLETARDCGIGHLLWFGNYPWQKQASQLTDVVRCTDWESVEREVERIAAA